MQLPSPASLPWNELRAAARECRGTAVAGDALRWSDAGWHHDTHPDDPRRAWLDLYLPVCNGGRERPFVIAHLGQSLDGFIATSSGDSNHVTGDENICHLHRLRALCDAVIVGAGTVASDDPRLTTRLVEGPSPLRIVLDPRRRLPVTHRVFCDGEARTLRVSCAPPDADLPQAPGYEELLLPADTHGGIDLPSLLRTLDARGCRRLFIEGGGGTVSTFLAAGLLDRLHIAVAPLIIGSGIPALRLAGQLQIGDCLRPPVRVYRMGEDVLYDFDLRGGARDAQAQASSQARAPHVDLARVY